MSFIGDIFHGVGNLLSGHSFGHQEQQSGQQQSPLNIIMPPAAPVEQAAPQQGAQGARPGAQSMTPSFLAAAALPGAGGSSGGRGLESNVGGKALLGQ